jgi:hypothetical protein
MEYSSGDNRRRVVRARDFVGSGCNEFLGGAAAIVLEMVEQRGIEFRKSGIRQHGESAVSEAWIRPLHFFQKQRASPVCVQFVQAFDGRGEKRILGVARLRGRFIDLP